MIGKGIFLELRDSDFKQTFTLTADCMLTLTNAFIANIQQELMPEIHSCVMFKVADSVSSSQYSGL